MIKRFIILVLFGIILSACATPKSNTLTPYDFDTDFKFKLAISKNEAVEISEEVLETINDQVYQGLSERNLIANDTENTYREAVVNLTSYRMRPDAARLTVGILAGCDNIKSNVAIFDGGTTQKIGESEITIEECGGWGVSADVIKKYSDGIVKYLLGKK